jgi:hypothetical protein
MPGVRGVTTAAVSAATRAPAANRGAPVGLVDRGGRDLRGGEHRHVLAVDRRRQLERGRRHRRAERGVARRGLRRRPRDRLRAALEHQRVQDRLGAQAAVGELACVPGERLVEHRERARVALRTAARRDPPVRQHRPGLGGLAEQRAHACAVVLVDARGRVQPHRGAQVRERDLVAGRAAADTEDRVTAAQSRDPVHGDSRRVCSVPSEVRQPSRFVTLSGAPPVGSRRRTATAATAEPGTPGAAWNDAPRRARNAHLSR